MKLPKKFPAKGWRKVKQGELIKRGDVWEQAGSILPHDNVDGLVNKPLVITGLYRKVTKK